MTANPRVGNDDMAWRRSFTGVALEKGSGKSCPCEALTQRPQRTRRESFFFRHVGDPKAKADPWEFVRVIAHSCDPFLRTGLFHLPVSSRQMKMLFSGSSVASVVRRSLPMDVGIIP